LPSDCLVPLEQSVSHIQEPRGQLYSIYPLSPKLQTHLMTGKAAATCSSSWVHNGGQWARSGVTQQHCTCSQQPKRHKWRDLSTSTCSDEILCGRPLWTLVGWRGQPYRNLMVPASDWVGKPCDSRAPLLTHAHNSTPRGKRIWLGSDPRPSYFYSVPSGPSHTSLFRTTTSNVT
jgi:hypothetical protein